MESPFPGMDPWLEDAGLWPNFHTSMITRIRDDLAAQLSSELFVAIEERVFSIPEYDAMPQIMIADVSIATMVDSVVRQPYLEIRNVRNQSVVTVIEMLSPTNKSPGRGRRSYERKRNNIVRGEVHLVEFDLLRLDGSFLPHLPGRSFHYTVHVHRVGDPPQGMIRPITMQQQLPVIPIPLREQDADVALDLQRAFHAVYNSGRFDVVLDYSAPPAVPLLPDDAIWADQLLRGKGLR